MDFRVSPSRYALEGAVTYKVHRAGIHAGEFEGAVFAAVVAVCFCPSTVTVAPFTPTPLTSFTLPEIVADAAIGPPVRIKGDDRT